jgi:hypothetical protein
MQKITNLNTKPYLEKECYSELRESIKDLLRHVKQTGEIEVYRVRVEE